LVLHNIYTDLAGDQEPDSECDVDASGDDHIISDAAGKAAKARREAIKEYLWATKTHRNRVFGE